MSSETDNSVAAPAKELAPQALKEMPRYEDLPKYIQPLSDRILVQEVPPPDKTAGGLILQESAREPLNIAVIVAVGPQVESLGVGDFVYHQSYVGDEVQIDGTSFRVMREEDATGKLTQGGS